MANMYYVDFDFVVTATKTILAESDEDAKEIAERLADDWYFFRDQLLPELRESTAIHENYLESRVSYKDDDDVEYEREIGRFLTDEDIAKYVTEGARHTFADHDQSHGGR